MYNEINDLISEFGKMFKIDEDSKIEYKNQIACNVIEEEAGYAIEANVPGALKENIEIKYDNELLTIAVKENKKENTNNKYLLQERLEKYYPRTIRLQNVNAQGIKAKLENGVLLVYVPKMKNEKKYINVD